MMHCCGRCEDFIEDWMSFGVSSWNPAQVMNDLAGIKKKYGNKMALIGCWDSSGPASWSGSSEDLVRQAVRDCIDRYAPGSAARSETPSPATKAPRGSNLPGHYDALHLVKIFPKILLFSPFPGILFP
jgi:hypothetical protein